MQCLASLWEEFVRRWVIAEATEIGRFSKGAIGYSDWIAIADIVDHGRGPGRHVIVGAVNCVGRVKCEVHGRRKSLTGDVGWVDIRVHECAGNGGHIIAAALADAAINSQRSTNGL